MCENIANKIIIAAKTLCMIGMFILLVLVGVIINSKMSRSNVETTYTISMQKVSGDWITHTYTLPDDSEFYISASRGSYSLMYSRKSNTFLRHDGGVIKVGIIDYKINP